jgi:hypothetical protein
MSERICLRYRRLPDGEFLSGYQIGWDGATFTFNPASLSPGLAPGDLLEIECGQTVYLGQLEAWHDSAGVVAVEHRIDLTRLTTLEKTWNKAGMIPQ